MTASHLSVEIDSQPDCWRQAERVALDAAPLLPRPGERVAVVGCGTSWFIGQSYATLRESDGHGHTDAVAASEFPALRRYDRVVAISRSGTTSEVLDVVNAVRGQVPTVAITVDDTTPIAGLVDAVVVLPFADEDSVVQTRFATSALALLRRSLGEELTTAIKDAEVALTQPLEPQWPAAEQFTFLGRGWTVGLAHEAALKVRETAGAWTESYPAMDYRHGPITVTSPGRVAWMLGPAPKRLAEDVADTGGTFVSSRLDPMAQLVLVQRLALRLAQDRGLDPDRPRHLTRSVILKG